MEKNHHYPYGLAMAGLSDKAVKTSYYTNKFRLAGRELQDLEFSDGSGLEIYDFGARYYDPQLGKWQQPDPLGEYMRRWSPYAYGFDNPLRFADGDGLSPGDSTAKPAPPPNDDPTGNLAKVKELPEVVVKATRKGGSSSVGSFLWGLVDYIPFAGSIKQIGEGIAHGSWKEAGLGIVMLGVDVATAGEGGEAIRLAEKGVEILAEDELKEVAEKEVVETVEKDASEAATDDAVHGNSKESTKPTEKYTISDEDGKEYHGVGQPGKRAEQSVKRLTKDYPGKSFSIKDRKTFPNRKEALKAEAGGLKGKYLKVNVYNKIIRRARNYKLNSMEISHPQYRQVHKKVPFYFYLNSDTLEEDIKWIAEHGIQNIQLSQYDGYSLKTIEPVLRLKHVKALKIYIEGVDLSRLTELHELEDLGIGEQNTNIDLSGLQQLKSLYLLYHKAIKGLNTLSGLEKLIVVKGKQDFFREELFRSWPKLSDLTLLSPKLPETLSFLKHQKELTALEIAHSRSKFRVGELEHVKGSLEKLQIGNCKGVSGIYELLPLLQQLKWFALTDCVALKDSRFADRMPNLEVLIVLGSSYFEDGDLTSLVRLKHVGIDDKKNYNLKTKDLVSKF